MALVFRDVRISNPLSRRGGALTLRFLVDTGALYSDVPAPLLRKLSIRPTRTATFELADGRSVRRRVGEAAFRIDGLTAISPVAFAGAKDEPLLGVVTLETLGLGVDPATGELRRARLLLKATPGSTRARRARGTPAARGRP